MQIHAVMIPGEGLLKDLLPEITGEEEAVAGGAAAALALRREGALAQNRGMWCHR